MGLHHLKEAFLGFIRVRVNLSYAKFLSNCLKYFPAPGCLSNRLDKTDVKMVQKTPQF